jgi:hypothetical protein
MTAPAGHAPRPMWSPEETREQVDQALGACCREGCTRCQHRDRQVDAVMAVIRELMTAAAASELALRERHVRELVALREAGQ